MNENGELQYERFTLKTRIIRFFRNVEAAWWYRKHYKGDKRHEHR